MDSIEQDKFTCYVLRQGK